MALRESIHDTDIDLFLQELVNLIDLRHELCALAGKIDWKALKRQFGGLYAPGVGRPGYPIGLMVGLQLLKYLRNISDEEVAWPPGLRTLTGNTSVVRSISVTTYPSIPA